MCLRRTVVVRAGSRAEDHAGGEHLDHLTASVGQELVEHDRAGNEFVDTRRRIALVKDDAVLTAPLGAALAGGVGGKGGNGAVRAGQH
jgi:hypothetical protein